MSEKAIRNAIRNARHVIKKPRADVDKYQKRYMRHIERSGMAAGGVPDPEIDHDLVNAATNHFGLTNRITEAGYVLSDGKMLDFSGRHEDPSYVKSGDSYKPKSGEDYMRDQRYTDHRNVSELLNAPSEGYIRDYISQALIGESPESLHPDELRDLRQEAIESYEGEGVDGLDAVSHFMKRGKAARVYPGEGVEFSHVPTPRQVNKIVSEHNKHYPDTPFNVDVVNPEGSSQATPVSKTFPKVNAEGVVNWVREALSSMTPSKAEGGAITPQPNELGLYSQGAYAAANLPQAKGTPQQFRSMLEGKNVKPDEFLHTGWDEAFADHPSVTREEVIEHFNKNSPQISERVLGSSNQYPYSTPDEWQNAISQAERRRDFDEVERLTLAWEGHEGFGGENEVRYEQYTLPGGENYREVLLKSGEPKTLPPKFIVTGAFPREFETREEAESYRNDLVTFSEGSSDSLSEMLRSRLARYPVEIYEQPPEFDVGSVYTSSHWRDPNVLAHIRMSDRRGPNGEKILHVEEIQSDWAQQGRKEGFKNVKNDKINAEVEKIRNFIDSDEFDKLSREEKDAIRRKRDDLKAQIELDSRVPSAPYVDSTDKWVDLSLKRIFNEAAKGGYDGIAFTPGSEQAKRYDLSQQVSKIQYFPATGNLKVFDTDGDLSMDRNNLRPEELPKHIGKEVAAKLLSDEFAIPNKFSEGILLHEMREQNLSVGGEGMKSFYDRMVPKQAEKLAKKIDKGSKVNLHHLPIHGNSAPAHYLPFTDDMREKILKGLPSFAKGGEVDGLDIDKYPTHYLPEVGRQVMAEGGSSMGGQNYIPHDDPRRQDNFSNWFGYSHIVDDSGNPVVLYHGTDADFGEFDPGKAGQTDHGWYGEGHYLTANPELASAYSGYKNFKAIEGEEIHPGQNVMPVHVRLENPYYWPDDRPAATSKEEARKITEELRKQGHDGVIAPNRFEDNPLHSKFAEVVVFTPHQMKSATGNNGNYSMRSARLNEAAGGSVKGAFKPDGSLKSDKGYVYHGTNAERASQIAREGMKLFDPSDFTDQDSWPDGSTSPRAYFSRNAGYVHSFLPEEGEGVVLRAKEPDHAKTERYTNDVYVEKPIPPHEFEILNESGEWEHLPSFFEGKAAGGSVVDLPGADAPPSPLSSPSTTSPSPPMLFFKPSKKEKIKTNEPTRSRSENSSVKKALMLTSSMLHGRAGRGTPR